MKEFDANIVIETERLILRYQQEKDKKEMFGNIYSDKEVLKYFIAKYAENIDDIPFDKYRENFLNAQKYYFSIVLKETNQVIGMILQCDSPNQMFNTVEIGYAIGKKYWNKGYTSEAMKAMIDFMFEQGVHKVCASYLEGNVASKRVMEKCHMIYEGKRKDEIFYHEQYYDTYFYYLLNPND